MTTRKQTTAAKRNIKRAQAKWGSMTKRQHSLAQPEGPSRTKPGLGGKGKFYHIEVRPANQFKTIRTQDVGEKGHLERRAGRRASGSWDTISWLVSKADAHISDGELKIDNPRVRNALIGKKQIRGKITHVKGDIFKAQPRRDVPEKEKPTTAQRKAQMANIRKAQRARWH